MDCRVQPGDRAEGKRLAPLLGNHVTPMPAQLRRGPRWFAGAG